MMMIGSHAMNFWLYHRHRDAKDIDLICSYDDFINHVEMYKRLGEKVKRLYPASGGKKWIAIMTNNIIVEAEITWEGSTAESLLKLAEENDPENNGVCASLDVLYTLKMSHRFKKNSPHFLKTMQDIRVMREHGAKIPEYLKEWFKEREAETYNYGHPKLNVAKEEFFSGDGIEYVYDHDSIHEAIACTGMDPAYKYYMQDGAAVMTSKDKFFEQSEVIQMRGVYEEACVLALERSQIPNGLYKVDPKKSFTIALEKVCTSITSGWFREYAWENYDRVMDHYLDLGEDWYVKKFKKGIAERVVKPYNGSIN